MGRSRLRPASGASPCRCRSRCKSANIYLIDDGPGQRILIDSGLGLPADEQALRAGLAEAGVALEDLSALILTHAHPDHIGLSGIIHAAAHLPIYMLEGEDDADQRRLGRGERARSRPQLDEMYRVNGMPDEIRAGSQKAGLALRRILRLPPADAITTLSDGQRLELGNHSYRGHLDAWPLGSPSLPAARRWPLHCGRPHPAAYHAQYRTVCRGAARSAGRLL